MNDVLKPCDYCIFVLHDRWGSPPSREGRYSSGTEEEYDLARGPIVQGTMMNLVMFFRQIHEARLSGRDSQLEKVLDFRAKLEAEKELLFYTYADLDDFESAFAAIWRPG